MEDVSHGKKSLTSFHRASSPAKRCFQVALCHLSCLRLSASFGLEAACAKTSRAVPRMILAQRIVQGQPGWQQPTDISFIESRDSSLRYRVHTS